MNVLIVSHNVLGGSSGMGKTLKTYFSEIRDCNVSQFYIHSEVPTDAEVCTNYYRFTDMETFKSRIPFCKTGAVFEKGDIQVNLSFSRVDRGTIGNVYQYGRKRTPAIYLSRNAAWKMAKWRSRRLEEWVDRAAPDVVFLAAGDYAFIYDIAVSIADYAHCALVVLCTDDYFLIDHNGSNHTNHDSQKFAIRERAKAAAGKIAKDQLMKSARRAMKRAECILCMCDEMRDEYRKLFNTETVTVYTGAVRKTIKADKSVNNGKHQMSYVGYLGGNRHKSIIELGNGIYDLPAKEKPEAIDVYSNEKREEIVKELERARGIRFHGEADPETAARVIANSEYVVHVEGFDQKSRRAVRYSISTKIADYLMNGPCIVAYGPKEVASMRYLADNGAGLVISDISKLSDELSRLFSDPGKYDFMIEHARELADRNHDIHKVGDRIYSILNQSINNYKLLRQGGEL